jgi:DNA mismatch repair ATPase MutS
MQQEPLVPKQSLMSKVCSKINVQHLFKSIHNIDTLFENVNECANKVGDKLESIEPLHNIKEIIDKQFVSSPGVYTDVEFFETYTNNNTKHQESVFDVINFCSTHGGKYTAKKIYKNPVCNYSVLQKRSEYLKYIDDVYSRNKLQIDEHINILKHNEHYIVWLLEEKDENLQNLYDVVFFKLKGLTKLNQSGDALTAYNLYRMLGSPLFGILSPMLYFVIPYLVLVYKLKLKVSFASYVKILISNIFSSDPLTLGSGSFLKYIRILSYALSTLFYFQGIFSSIDLAKTVHKISKLLINNLNGVIKYIKSTIALCEMIWRNEVLQFFDDFNLTSSEQQIQEQNILHTLQERQFSIFTNFGKQLKALKFIDKSVICNIVKKSYIMDALLGAINYKHDNKFCFAEYIRSGNKKPVINIQGLTHPCIKKNKAVPNNIKFENNQRNAIITSPNSSGKSVLIKSIVVNVLMAQTMGVCACQSLQITPFRYINTQINVPDSTGFESLFEAEMHRCKYILDNLKILNNNSLNTNYYLILMDEIFNSTNPIEAVSGAYAVCKKLSSYESNMLIFTTHYNYLTKLAKTNNDFKNYRMQTIVDGDDIQFTYKLETGVNKHLLALELLKKSGFDDDIIEDAISIKQKLQK